MSMRASFARPGIEHHPATFSPILTHSLFDTLFSRHRYMTPSAVQKLATWRICFPRVNRAASYQQHFALIGSYSPGCCSAMIVSFSSVAFSSFSVSPSNLAASL